MQVSKNLISKFRQPKTNLTFDDLIIKVQNVILSNTNSVLHKRIIDKISNLNFDLKTNFTSSEYDYKTNTVFIGINHVYDFNVYLHEIMHAIGTQVRDTYTNIGINKRTLTKINDDNFLFSNYGYGANEGLNQHYTEKFLQNTLKNENIKISEVAPNYSFCANIMACLEKIIGEKNMKYAHFSEYGLDYLIYIAKRKCHLPNDNKILKLILQLDAYKTISQTHMMFGVLHTTDTKLILTDAYKTLLTIALMYAKHHNNQDVLYSQIILPEHLSGDNLIYFTKYIQPELIKYFYQEKEHIFNDKTSDFIGMQNKPFMEYTKLLFNQYVNKIPLSGSNIPDEIKCGEFYNHIMLSCMIYNSNGNSKAIYSNDFFKILTVSIFDKNSKLAPVYKKEKTQLVNQILASRNVVRCGAEISDEIIIECTDDFDFNIYLMETMSDYYKQIFPYVSDKAKSNPILVEKMLSIVFKTNVEKYKFVKYMPTYIKNKPEIKDIMEKYLNVSNKNVQPYNDYFTK